MRHPLRSKTAVFLINYWSEYHSNIPHCCRVEFSRHSANNTNAGASAYQNLYLTDANYIVCSKCTERDRRGEDVVRELHTCGEYYLTDTKDRYTCTNRHFKTRMCKFMGHFWDRYWDWHHNSLPG